DVARPRFAEMRETLRRDLAALAPPREPAPTVWRRLLQRLSWPLAWPDERREWFRDELMRHLARVRRRLLEEGAKLTAADRLDAAEDVFWRHGDDLRPGGDMREAVAERRRAAEALRDVPLPLTARADEIEAILKGQARFADGHDGRRAFEGIAL